MVVDDEEIIRRSTARMLSRLGYQVTTVNNGYEAIDLFDKNKELLKYVMLDINMPGISGIDCINAFLEQKPGIRIILMSGDPEIEFEDTDISANPAISFMQKPLEVEEISAIFNGT